jgi:MFS family permease
MPAETRMDSGWRLVRTSRSMLALGAAYALCGAGIGVATLSLPRAHGAAILVLVVLGLIAAGIGVVFQAGITFAADEALDGDRMTAREALGDARERLGALLAWALIVVVVQLLFGLLLNLSSRFGMLISIATFIWSFCTVFVVPMLALELLSPLEALREAPELLRRRWGEEFAGMFGIGAVATLAAIVPGILLSLGAHYNHREPGSGTLAVVIGAVALLAIVVLTATTAQAFVVTLYRDGTVGFPDELAYVERRPRRKSWIVRIGLAIGALLLAAAVIGAILGPRPAEREFKVSFPASYSSQISTGMPVIYEGKRVGVVKSSEITAETDIVSFEVESPYETLKGESSITLSEFEGGPCLVIVPNGQGPPLPQGEGGRA